MAGKNSKGSFKMKGYSYPGEAPTKFLGKFMRNSGVGRTLGKAAKYGAFGPLGMAAAAAGGAYKKGGGNVPPHGDEAHGGGGGDGGAAAAQQAQVDAAAAQEQEQAPVAKRGAVEKGKEKLWKKAGIRPDPDYEGGDTIEKSGAVRRGQQELGVGPFKMKGFGGFGNTPLKDKQERQEKRRGRQLKRAKKKGRWMHGQEMREEDGQLKTMEGHSWSTGDKERKVKDPHGVVSSDTPDYPSDDFKYYYKKNLKGDIKLLGKEGYEDLPPVEVKKKKKK